MSRGTRLTPAQLFAARAAGGLPRGYSIRGVTPVIRVPDEQHVAEAAIGPRIYRPEDYPPGMDIPTQPREPMDPVMPRGQQRGSVQIVTINSGVFTALPTSLIDIADTEDRAENMTLSVSVQRLSQGGTDVLGLCQVQVDWGVSGGIHSARMDLGRGFVARFAASAMRVTAQMQGIGTYRVAASVGAFEGGNRRPTLTVARSFAGAGSDDHDLFPFVSQVRLINDNGLGYTFEWRSLAGVVLGQVVVGAGVGEAGPFVVPQGADIARLTVAAATNIRAIYELHL